MTRRKRADIIAEIKVAEVEIDELKRDLDHALSELHALEEELKTCTSSVQPVYCAWCTKPVTSGDAACPHCGFVFEPEEEEAA